MMIMVRHLDDSVDVEATNEQGRCPIISLPDLEFVKKFTRPNFQAKEFYTLKTHKARLFLPAINSESALLSVIWPSFG